MTPAGVKHGPCVDYVELHFHLLPGVDDGPRLIEDSLALAAAAVADGTGTVVVTPHVHPEHIVDPGEIPERVAELAARLRREHIPLRVLAGGEIAHGMVERLSDDQLELIAHGPRRRRWLLLEAPFDGLDAGFTAAADELRGRGFAPLVAHPERSSHIPGTTAALAHERAMGSAFQVTAASLAGAYGKEARWSAVRLLRSSAQTVIASDAHGRARPPALQSALGALTAEGERDPARFVSTIPRALLGAGLPKPEATRAA
jgi:protein-tyrosine phosphatase